MSLEPVNLTIAIADTRKSWAVVIGHEEQRLDGTPREGFTGIFWFNEPRPPCQAGLTIALFETRALARVACRHVKQTHKTARVARVRVTIDILRRD